MGGLRPIFFAMKETNTKRITFCGIIAALYAALTVSAAGWSYGPIQFRISELLCILCFINPAATWGLTLGCFIANLFSTVSPLDIIVGTAATALGCLLSAKIKNIWLFPLPIILCNALLVGAELSIVLTPDSFFQGLLLYSFQVGLGEAVILYVGGVPLLRVLGKSELAEKLQKL